MESSHAPTALFKKRRARDLVKGVANRTEIGMAMDVDGKRR